MTLLDAVNAGDVGAAKAAIAAGALAEGRDSAGGRRCCWPPVPIQAEIARLLIKAGADVNAKDNIRDTPFLYAGAEGRNEILKAILADRPRRDLDGHQPLWRCRSDSGRPSRASETVRILLATEIDIDHVNNLGWTALLEAVILGDGGLIYRRSSDCWSMPALRAYPTGMAQRRSSTLAAWVSASRRTYAAGPRRVRSSALRRLSGLATTSAGFDFAQSSAQQAPISLRVAHEFSPPRFPPSCLPWDYACSRPRRRRPSQKAC